MRIFNTITSVAMAVFCLIACKSKPADSSEAKSDIDAEAPGIEFADPFILLDGDTYYAYGTKHDSGIEVYSSDDLMHWSPVGLALDKKDSYADRWFWAPEIYKVNGRYLMYYSADEHICVAESDSPVGPFVQKDHKPMLEEKVIDNSLFIDTDGKPYLYFVRFNDGLNIWVAELEPDLLTIKQGTLQPCIKRSQEWEFETVNEGPYVFKQGDKYYMTYSGNGYTNPEYGIGLATAQSPMGPWEKCDKNPIFQFPETKSYGKLNGVGHSAMFIDKDGNKRIVFHAHKNKEQVHPREMYISTFEIDDSANPAMSISAENTIKPTVDK